jgi:hypothetical protein
MEHPDKLAMATKSRYMTEQMIRESIEIKLLSRNMNTEDSLCLSQSWKPSFTLSNGVETPCHRSECPDMSF